MKRYKTLPGDPGVTLFDAICDPENIVRAHINASKGKSWYKEIIMVNSNPQYYLGEVRRMLVEQTYVNSSYEEFDREENGKMRHIYKLPYYPDRIIQWAILQVIGPILNKKFISTTYSSIPDRGPFQCMQKVSSDIINDPEGTVYCLKIDIHHFYQSINHDGLKNKYRKIFKDEKLLWLLFTIIDSIPDEDGIPIGNYTSQYSGNIYLSEFDHWIKETKGIKYYYRYMDDMVFLHSNKEDLHQLLKDIKTRLEDVELLALKPNYQVFPTVVRGVDYVGYKMFRDHVLVRKRIVSHFIQTCNRINRKGHLSDHDKASLFSYMGYLQHANTYNLQMKYYEPIRIKYGLKNQIKTNVR